jgi:hypothetical protein
MLEFSVSCLGGGNAAGVLLVIRDITRVAGPAPICTHCKSVGNGQGGWQPIEGYLQARAGIALRQEMCPACMRALYPELC